MTAVELWTDGSGLATGGGYGGWAYVLRTLAADGTVLELEEASGSIDDRACTNQRAELTAVIWGLDALAEPTTLTVVSDSEYVLGGLDGWLRRWAMNGWRNRLGEPVANQDLWRELARRAELHQVATRHVKGHARTYACELCDWSGEEPLRLTPTARNRFCPACGDRVVTRPMWPLNARCDELAGAARRALLQRAAGSRAVAA